MHANMQAAGYYLDYSVMQLSGVVSNLHHTCKGSCPVPDSILVYKLRCSEPC